MTVLLLALASAVAFAPAGSAHAMPVTSDLVLSDYAGYSADVYPTGSQIGSILIETASHHPGCRDALHNVVHLVPESLDAYRGDIKSGPADNDAVVAFSVIVGLDDPHLGRTLIDGWSTVIASCPDTDLGPNQFGTHAQQMHLNGVDGQVGEVFTINSPDFPDPKPAVFYYTEGIFGMLEVVPTGDVAADVALCTRLAQAQVDRINAVRA